jgi:hypothetical protein
MYLMGSLSLKDVVKEGLSSQSGLWGHKPWLPNRGLRGLKV